MICSSLNLLRFIPSDSFASDSIQNRSHFRGARHIKREKDGSFSFTVDDKIAEDRPNHLQTSSHVKFLFVRDTMVDWTHETPYQLHVERLGEASSSPIDRTTMAARAAFRMIEDVPLYFWFARIHFGLAPNTARPLTPAGAIGGLPAQALTQGHLSLRPGEAALLTIDHADAAYCSAQVCDWWFRAIDIDRHRSSLTQADAALPGSPLRFVVAPHDPGVTDWLDTGGLQETLLILRWQGLPTNRSSIGPNFDLKIFKVDDLPSDLPRVTPEERANQIQRRAEAAMRRYPDRS